MDRNVSVGSTSSSLAASFNALRLAELSKISIHDVYEKVLQVAIIDYRTEPRFRKPIAVPKQAPALASPSASFAGPGSSSSSSAVSKRLSHNGSVPSSSSSKHIGKILSHFDSKDDSSSPKLPKVALGNLKQLIHSIAIKSSLKTLSPSTRRCCLSFYSMIDQIPPSDARSPEALIGAYAKAVHKEIQFIKNPNEEANAAIFKEVAAFISILIRAIQGEKNAEPVIAHLKSYKASLETKTQSMVNYGYPSASPTSANDPNNEDVAYIEPPCGLNEMDFAKLIGRIFNKDSNTLQNDINRLKESSTETALQEDLKALIVSLRQNAGIYQKLDFDNEQQYHRWKDSEQDSITVLLAKLKRPAAMKRQTAPAHKNGPFHVIPAQTREFFVRFVELCLKFHNGGSTVFGNTTHELIQKVASFWRLGDTAKASLVFTAANNTVINITTAGGDILDIDTDKAESVITFAFSSIKEELDSDILSWPEPDKREWANNVQICYLHTMCTIRNLLGAIFEPDRPKFKLYMIFLDFLRQDPTFEEHIERSGAPKKWEKKLRIALGKATDAKYAEILSKVPRDSSLGLVHVYEAADQVTDVLTLTQKRFKSPFLGFLKIPQITTREFTTGFGNDAKAMLFHIVNYTKEQNNGDMFSIPYSDAMDVYKKLADIRFAYSQVVDSKRTPFPFRLESFFYPFIEKFVQNAEAQIKELTVKAIGADNFELNEDEETSFSKSSTSVKDCLSIFRSPLKILEELGWENEYQINKLYTVIIKGISDSIVLYGYKCLELIINDLNDDSDQPDEDEDIYASQEEETNAMRWFSGVKAAVTGNHKIEPPKPYRFKKHTCVALNNIGAMLENIDRLEEQVNPEKVSNVIRKYEGAAKASGSFNLFSIKIVRAEGLKAVGADGFSDTYVVLTDANSRTTIGKTRKILDDLNPQWNEEFELTVPISSPGSIIATVWDDSKSSLKSHEVLGRATLQLDPKRYNDNGIAHDRWLNLNTQGRILLSISMESEKVDALFCLGRAHRSLIRARDRVVSLMVNKFSKFIFYTLSRPTLRTICGNNGTSRPDKDILRNAISPLGNYLNSNLAVLAQTLTMKLLFKVMLESWSVIVTTADLLLLPPLSSARNALVFRNDSGSNRWQNAVSSTFAATLGGNANRPLTQVELEVTFEWLKILCVEFFYANGEGPPLEKLQDHRYQKLLLIPVYYVTEVSNLLEEVEQLVPVVNRYIQQKNMLEFADVLNTNKMRKAKTLGTEDVKLSRSGTIARSKTIMAQGSSKARAQAQKEIRDAESDPLAMKADTEDIILRILVAKGEKQRVAQRLQERDKVAEITENEIVVRAAAQGVRLIV